MNKESERIAAFKAFSEMDHETLERYLVDWVPVPPKDKPFIYESPDSKTNPLMVEMMESTRCISLMERILRIRNLSLFLLAALVMWLVGSNVWFWIALGITVVVDQWFITLQLKARRDKFMDNYFYVGKLASRYIDPAIGHQTYWNLERLKKWAVARYDFTSAETFMSINGKEGELAERGPLAGRFVSTITGEEWKLRPELLEAG
jgi:hypothetical protein